MNQSFRYQLLKKKYINLNATEKSAHFLLRAQLVTCIHLFPQLQLMYVWQKDIITIEKVIVFLKARQQNHVAIKQLCLQQPSHEVTELTDLPIRFRKFKLDKHCYRLKLY